MQRSVKYLLLASLLAVFPVRPASAGADLLFKNFTGDPFGDGGALYTGGGPCFVSCFAIGDNFEATGVWIVNWFVYYMLYDGDPVALGSNVRFAVYTTAGVQVVAPTSASPTVTSTGLTYSSWTIYKLEITGLNIVLLPGQYQFRATNTNVQAIYPALGTASVQTVSPGLIQLTGSGSVETVASTNVTQRFVDWAFEVWGTNDTELKNSFEDL